MEQKLMFQVLFSLFHPLTEKLSMKIKSMYHFFNEISSKSIPSYWKYAITTKAKKLSKFCFLDFSHAYQIKTYFLVVTNHIGDVMVSMLVSSAVDHEFETRSGQTKDYKIGICCFSAKNAA